MNISRNNSLKAFNPNAPDNSDRRTPEELIAVIRQAQQEIDKALQALAQSEIAALPLEIQEREQ